MALFTQTLTVTGTATVNVQKMVPKLLPTAWLSTFRPALFFNGYSTSITWTNSTAALTPTTPMTYSARIRMARDAYDNPSSQIILVYGYFYLYVRRIGAGLNSLRLRYSDGSASRECFGSFPLFDRDEHGIVAVYQPTGGNNSTLKLFIDGTLLASTNMTTLPATLQSAGGGKVGATASGFFHGYLRDCRVFDGYAVSDTEAAALSASGTNPAATPLVSFPLDEGSGATATDVSGNSHSSTIVGGSWTSVSLFSRIIGKLLVATGQGSSTVGRRVYKLLGAAAVIIPSLVRPALFFRSMAATGLVSLLLAARRHLMPIYPDPDILSSDDDLTVL